MLVTSISLRGLCVINKLYLDASSRGFFPFDQIDACFHTEMFFEVLSNPRRAEPTNLLALA